jgi:hypothetical protein
LRAAIAALESSASAAENVAEPCRVIPLASGKALRHFAAGIFDASAVCAQFIE